MRLGSRAAIFTVALLLSPSLALGQGLRELHIETFIYTERDKPVSENLTLFTQGKVFDFRMDVKTHEPMEVAIFDPARGEFQLFDIGSKRRVAITQEEIASILARLSTSPDARKKDELLLNPESIAQWEEKFDPATGWLEIRSPQDRLLYRARGDKPPRNPDTLNAYYNFIDWYTKLNGANPTKMPPFARLHLNQAIRKKGIIPTQVELIYTPPGLVDRTLRATSKHYISWDLTKSDQQRIESVRELIGFERVKMAEYLSPSDNLQR